MAGRHRTGRLAAASAGAAVAATLLLAGCSAGQVAATAQVVSAVPGGSTVVNVPDPTNLNSAILIQNVTVAYSGPAGYAPGQNAPLAMRIINQTQSPVRVTPGDAALLSAKSDASTGTPLGSLAWSGGRGALVTGPSSAPTAPGSPSVAPSGSPLSDLVIPAGTIAILAPGVTGSTRYVQITNLSQPVVPGDTVTLSFTFTVLTGAGPGTFNASVAAPIAPPAVPLPRVSVSVNEGGQQG